MISEATAVALQPDGKIVAVGRARGFKDQDDFALARYGADGSLDTTFSFDGLVTTDFADSLDIAYAMAIQSDGKIVAAGGAGDFQLARYQGDFVSQNQPPVIADQTFSIDVNALQDGAVVGAVAASDPDPGQTLSYQITDGNTNSAFAINSSTGQITVASSAAFGFKTPRVFTLTVQVTDDGAPALSSTATITINVTQGKQQKTVTDKQAPTPPTAFPTIKPLTFSRASGNAISISAGLTYAPLVQVSLSVLHGKLTLASTAGLTFQAGDGKGDRTMTFRGTIAAIDAALNGLTYVPDKGYAGTDRAAVATSALVASRRQGRVITPARMRFNGHNLVQPAVVAHRPAVRKSVIPILVSGKK